MTLMLKTPADPLESLRGEIGEVTGWLAERPISVGLAADLDARFPPEGDLFARLAALASKALAAHGQAVDPTTTYLRLCEPGPQTHGFSVDLVRLADVRGPRHHHPKGEIDLIVPVSRNGRFDGHARGWLTLPPGSAHRPTASGEVVVIYLLPNGEMTF